LELHDMTHINDDDDPPAAELRISGPPHRLRVYHYGRLVGVFGSLEAIAAALAEFDDYSDQEPRR
jgi:hypothetical protein